MQTSAFLLTLALAAALTAGTVQPQTAARVPVLLELFTSEGCSDCPPADRVLEALDRAQPVSGADLIVISEHVDYWNHLGWSDPFSSPAFSARQRQYASRLNTGEVYTPQLVVDGAKAFVGSNRANALGAIGDALRAPKIAIAVTAQRSGTIHVTAPLAESASKKVDVFVVLASDHANSQVRRGENAGKTLSHVAVAYAFDKVASWNTGGSLDRDFPIKLKTGPTRVIVFLQDPLTSRILGIAHTTI